MPLSGSLDRVPRREFSKMSGSLNASWTGDRREGSRMHCMLCQASLERGEAAFYRTDLHEWRR